MEKEIEIEWKQIDLPENKLSAKSEGGTTYCAKIPGGFLYRHVERFSGGSVAAACMAFVPEREMRQVSGDLS